jgi:hypothetical protein
LDFGQIIFCIVLGLMALGTLFVIGYLWYITLRVITHNPMRGYRAADYYDEPGANYVQLPDGSVRID